MKRAIYAIGVSLMCALPAAAHHGRDFLMVEAYELPHPHTVYFVSSEMFSHASDGTTFTTEPSLLFGVTERFAGEVHLHVARVPGESLRYEAVAPAIHFQLTPPEASHLWRFAAAAEYELARHSDENSLGARLCLARSTASRRLHSKQPCPVFPTSIRAQSFGICRWSIRTTGIPSILPRAISRCFRSSVE